MSKIVFLPKGGINGISFEINEYVAIQKLFLEKYGNKTHNKEFIPLPNIEPKIQVENFENCDHGAENKAFPEYFEGMSQHGWCCKKCGFIIQYG